MTAVASWPMDTKDNYTFIWVQTKKNEMNNQNIYPRILDSYHC